MYAVLSTLKRHLEALLRQDEGQGLVEYGLILALIAVVAIAALTFLGGDVSSTLTNVGNTLANAGG